MRIQSINLLPNTICIVCLTLGLFMFSAPISYAKDTKEIEDILSQSTILQENGQCEAALQLLESLLNKGNLSKDTLSAKVYHKIGVSHYCLNELDQTQAIEYWKKALEIRQEILPATAISVVKGFYNIGSAYYQMNEFEKAASYFIKSQNLHLENPQKDTSLLCKTYRDFGSVQITQKNFDSAESYLLKANNLAERYYLPKGKVQDQCEYYTALFEFYYENGAYNRAISYLKKGLDLYAKILPESKNDSMQIADYQNNLGLIYSENGQLDSANLAYQIANQINKKYEDRKSNLAINYYNLAENYFYQESTEAALRNIDLAIALDAELKNKLDLAWDYYLKASILEGKKDLESALEQYQEAIKQLCNGFEHNDVMELPSPDIKMIDPILGIELLDAKAQLIQKYADITNQPNQLEDAINTYDYISQTLDRIRLGFQSEDAKSFLASESKAILERAIDLNFQLYQENGGQKYLRQAYQYVAQSKAVILLDALHEAGAKEFAGIPNDLLDQEKELNNALANIEQQIFEATEDKQALYDERIAIERQLYQLKTKFERDYPQYIQLKYNNQLLQLSEIQSTLDRTMIEYFVGQENLYVFIIRQDHIEWLKLPFDFNLREEITNLRIGLYGKYTGKPQEVNYDSLFVHHAHFLYQKLIAPFYEKINLSEQIIFIPDGILGYIPFEVLLKDIPKQLRSPSTYSYLLREHQISYCYSAALLQEMQKKKHNQQLKNFIAFAPIFGDDASSLAINRAALKAMEYNIPEAKAIKDLFKGKLLEAFDATETSFKKYAPRYKVIHLATHGISDDEVGDYAFLAFTAIEDSIENEFLYNRELYNLQLNADMVVLSACETGIGKLQEGEGIISLARGFSYAGAKSIITTLWSVNDASTKELMEVFYNYLKEGKSKDTALRQAKLDFIDRYGNEAHPFYWAGFVGVGDMSALNLSNGIAWWWIYLFLPIMIFYFWYRQKYTVTKVF